MGERISATEDKVEEMLSVMGKENLKRKKSWPKATVLQKGNMT